MTSETTRPKLTLKRSVGREESLGLSFPTRTTNPFPLCTHRPGERVGKAPPKQPLCSLKKQARPITVLWENAAAFLQCLCDTSLQQRKKEREGEGGGTQKPHCLKGDNASNPLALGLEQQGERVCSSAWRWESTGASPLALGGSCELRDDRRAAFCPLHHTLPSWV